MKKRMSIAVAFAIIATAATQSFAQTGACYTVDTAGFTINCQGSMTEAACAGLLNGVWHEGHDCNDVDGDGIIDPFITYNQIDPVQYGACGEFTIAGATLFLCSSASDFVTGSTVVIDGGVTAG